MKRNKLIAGFKLFFMAVILVVIASSAHAQDYKSDIRKIADVYGKAKKYSVNIHYALFPSYTANVASEHKTGLVKKKDQNYYASYFGTEIMQTWNTSCIIDNEQKIISVENKAKQNRGVIPDLDQQLKLYKSVTYSDRKGTLGCYTFVMAHNMYSKIELEFDKKTYAITRVVYYLARATKVQGSDKIDKPRLEISFTDFNTKPAFSKSDFSTRKYFKKNKKNQYIPAAAYRSYKIRSY